MERVIVGYVVPYIPVNVRPNHLSWARVWGVPCLWLLFLLHPLLALITYMFLVLTDAVDGPLARSRKILEGKRLDEMSDKALVVGTMGLLFTAGLLPFDIMNPTFAVVALIIIRECMITMLREWKPDQAATVPSLPLAKLKTFIMMPALGIIMASGETAFGEQVRLCGIWLLYLSLFFSLISAGQYMWYFMRQPKKLL